MLSHLNLLEGILELLLIVLNSKRTNLNYYSINLKSGFSIIWEGAILILKTMLNFRHHLLKNYIRIILLDYVNQREVISFLFPAMLVNQ